MPAKAKKLPPAMVENIAAWINTGAPYDKPLVDTKLAVGEMQITDTDRQYWAFAPLAKPASPAVENTRWPENEIDRFILAKLEEAKLQRESPGVKPDAVASCVLRPDQPAANPGGDRGVPLRCGW